MNSIALAQRAVHLLSRATADSAGDPMQQALRSLVAQTLDDDAEAIPVWQRWQTQPHSDHLQSSFTRLLAERLQADAILAATLAGLLASWPEPAPPPEEHAAERADFARLLAQHFNESELHALCFELGVDDEELRGSVKSEKIISLIQHMEQQGRVVDLLQLCRQQRPLIAWPEALKPPDISPLPAAPGTSIDQSVHINIDRGARAGDVIGRIDRIEKWINVIKQPALWQDAIWRFLSQHRLFLLVALILDLVLFALYWAFKNLYQIAWPLWAGTTVLLTVAAWNWYVWGWQAPVRTRRRLLAALVPSLLVASIVGWQAWRIAFPQPLPPQALGILVAELGAGASYQPLGPAALISDQVYNRLCQVVEAEFGDTCGDLAARHVAVRQVGIIANASTAKWYGARLGAEIVIWGQYVSNAQGATIRFQILETLETAVNPGYPLILPVTNSAADIIVREQDLSDRETLKEVLAQQTGVVSAFTLGMLAYVDRDYPRALEQLEAAVDIIGRSPVLEIPGPGKSLIYYYLGKAYQHMEQPDRGQEWLMRARDANAKEPAVYAGLASGHGMLGQEEERLAHLAQAQAHISDWLRTHPEDKIAIYDRGQLFQTTNELRLAITNYERVITLDPDYTIAYISLGEAERRQGNWEAAEQWLQEALRVAGDTDTNPAWAYLNLALVYRQAGQPASAHEAYRSAITYEPEIDAMYFEYAQFLTEQREMDAALATYQQMVEVSHNKGWAYEKLGNFQRERGLLEDAAVSYENAIANQPENPMLYTLLGDTRYEQGDIEGAWQTFGVAVAIGTANYYPYARYGYRLHQQGELSRAASLYEASLERRPLDCPILQNLGLVYVGLAQPEKAIKMYQQLLAISDMCANPDQAARLAREQLEALSVAPP